MTSALLATEDTGTPGTEGHFEEEEAETGEFVPKNLVAYQEVQSHVPAFRWEVVQNWCTAHRKVLYPWVDHMHDRGHQCSPRTFVRFHNYPTINGKSPSLDALLVLLRQGKVHELDQPGQAMAVSRPSVRRVRERRRRDSEVWQGGW